MQIKYSTILVSILIALTSCKQKDTNTHIDEGNIKNDTYTSKDIGWSITIPNDWEVISKAQHEATQQKGLDAIEDMIESEVDVSGLKNLIGFQKDQYNMFQSTSEPFEVAYEGEWEENNALLKELVYNTYVDLGITSDSSATKIINVDGLDFHTYNLTVYDPKGAVILNQIMYSRLINGFDFGVNINYNNDADKEALLEVWLNSKFSN